jgi:large subunit ribosomal protein L32
MAAINLPQAGVSRVISNFISSHIPAVSSLATRLSAPTSTTVSASAAQTNEDCMHEAYETPSGTFASLLAELFPPFLLAVPKSKTSHSRKSMRSANKGLKNKTSESSCLELLPKITI